MAPALIREGGPKKTAPKKPPRKSKQDFKASDQFSCPQEAEANSQAEKIYVSADPEDTIERNADGIPLNPESQYEDYEIGSTLTAADFSSVKKQRSSFRLKKSTWKWTLADNKTWVWIKALVFKSDGAVIPKVVISRSYHFQEEERCSHMDFSASLLAELIFALNTATQQVAKDFPPKAATKSFPASSSHGLHSAAHTAAAAAAAPAGNAAKRAPAQAREIASKKRKGDDAVGSSQAHHQGSNLDSLHGDAFAQEGGYVEMSEQEFRGHVNSLMMSGEGEE